RRPRPSGGDRVFGPPWDHLGRDHAMRRLDRGTSPRGPRSTQLLGYNPIAWMAPDPVLAPGGWEEVRAATEALKAAGIEVILDIVLNHSGEGDALGPTLSFRGLDNATYYSSRPGAPWRYANDT